MRANAGLIGVVIVCMTIFVALIIGAMTSIFPWWLMLVLFIPPLVFWLGAKWPPVAMVVALSAAYGFMPIGLIAADIVVLGFVAFIAWVYRKQLYKVITSFESVVWTTGLLMAWGLFSIIYGHFYRFNPIEPVYSESMTLAYWTIMFPILLIGHDKKRSTYTFYVLMLLGTALGVIALCQSIFGLRLTFGGLSGVAELTSDEGGIAGLARSSIPGILLLVFMLLVALFKTIGDHTKYRFLWGCLFVVLFMALIVTFGRAIWAATFVAALVGAFLCGRGPFLRFIFIGGPILVSLIVLLYIFEPDFVAGIFNRLLSVRTEFTAKGSSLKWRLIENQFAYVAMANNPIMGIGLGGEYKPRLIDMRQFRAQTHYIHNGYYFIFMKMGLIGMTLYMLNCFNILRLSWRNRSEAGVDATLQNALIALYVVAFIVNVTQPEFMQGPSVASLAAVSAVVMSLGHWHRRSVGKEPTPNKTA